MMKNCGDSNTWVNDSADHSDGGDHDEKLS